MGVVPYSTAGSIASTAKTWEDFISSLRQALRTANDADTELILLIPSCNIMCSWSTRDMRELGVPGCCHASLPNGLRGNSLPSLHPVPSAENVVIHVPLHHYDVMVFLILCICYTTIFTECSLGSCSSLVHWFLHFTGSCSLLVQWLMQVASSLVHAVHQFSGSCSSPVHWFMQFNSWLVPVVHLFTGSLVQWFMHFSGSCSSPVQWFL